MKDLNLLFLGGWRTEVPAVRREEGFRDLALSYFGVRVCADVLFASN